MKWRAEQFPRRESAARARRRRKAEALEQRFLRQLSYGVAPPDLTGAIMGRLGYMRISRTIARKRWLRMWFARTVMCALALLITAAALEINNVAPWARRPAGPTITAAVENDLELHQRRLSRTFQAIRNWTPQASDSSEQEWDSIAGDPNEPAPDRLAEIE